MRFAVRVTKTVEERFSRLIHGKAGAGSNISCVCCNMSRGECLKDINFGSLKVTATNELEREAVQFCLDNPLGWTREKLEKYAEGMKTTPITTTDLIDEIPDNLHQQINVSSFFSTINTRIKAVENDTVKK